MAEAFCRARLVTEMDWFKPSANLSGIPPDNENLLRIVPGWLLNEKS